MLLEIRKASHEGGLPESQKAEALSLQRGVKEPLPHIDTERDRRQCPPRRASRVAVDEHKLLTRGSFSLDHPPGTGKGLLIQKMTEYPSKVGQKLIDLRSCIRAVQKGSQKEQLAFEDVPLIDHDPIASRKVPILHSTRRRSRPTPKAFRLSLDAAGKADSRA